MALVGINRNSSSCLSYYLSDGHTLGLEEILEKKYRENTEKTKGKIPEIKGAVGVFGLSHFETDIPRTGGRFRTCAVPHC